MEKGTKNTIMYIVITLLIISNIGMYITLDYTLDVNTQWENINYECLNMTDTLINVSLQCIEDRDAWMNLSDQWKDIANDWERMYWRYC